MAVIYGSHHDSNGKGCSNAARDGDGSRDDASNTDVLTGGAGIW